MRAIIKTKTNVKLGVEGNNKNKNNVKLGGEGNKNKNNVKLGARAIIKKHTC